MTCPGGTPEKPASADLIERHILERIRPDPATLERLASVREHIVDRVVAEARSRASPMVRALVAGSAARGTFLNDRVDVDLFLLFPPGTTRETLEKEGLALGRAILTETETRYAEHPYLRGRFEGFRVDAVPGYAITDPSHPMSAVDRTPFHHDYLRERQTPEMVDQVRLTKQFLRALGVYGSEARTEGFSGYLVELLVLHFGSLQSLLKAAQSWRLPVRLSSRTLDPPRIPIDVGLILADPVDPNRNVATALSRRNLALFLLASQEYLRSPSEQWFEPRKDTRLSVDEARRLVRDRGTHAAVVGLPRPPLVDDILYPQLRKAERAIGAEVERLGFCVIGTASAGGEKELLVLLEVATGRLPLVKVQDGPPAGIDRVGSFLSKWTRPDAPILQGPYLRPDGKLAIEVRRAEREIEPMLRASLATLPVGKDIKAGVGSTSWVRALEKVEESETLSDALNQLLSKRLPWLGRR